MRCAHVQARRRSPLQRRQPRRQRRKLRLWRRVEEVEEEEEDEAVDEEALKKDDEDFDVRHSPLNMLSRA